MRLLFLANNLAGADGWSRYARDLISALGREHQILCLVNKTSARLDIRQAAVLDSPLRYLANPIISWLTARKINHILSEFKPDIIHFIAEPYAALLPFIKVKQAKTVMTVHGTYAYPPALFDSFIRCFISRFFIGIIYKKIDCVITVSNFTKNHLLKSFNSAKLLSPFNAKISVITNGLDLAAFPAVSSSKSSNQIRQILFVGAVKSGKGILESLSALAYYKNNFSGRFQFKIVGNFKPQDAYYLRLRKFIAENSLADQVAFAGRIGERELLNFYRSADLFLMPSLNVADKWVEGFGLVYLEAASQGMPCIGSKESGAAEAVIDGETGYLVDARNPADIAEKIDLVLNKRMIKPEACLAWARKNEIKNKVNEVIELYRKVMNK